MPGLVGTFAGRSAPRSGSGAARLQRTGVGVVLPAPGSSRARRAAKTVTDGAVAVIEEVVADKGHHSRTTVHDLETLEIRSYISEPDRGAQSWIDQEAERDAVYANRRRIRGDRGKRLLRRRGELLERSFPRTAYTTRMSIAAWLVTVWTRRVDSQPNRLKRTLSQARDTMVRARFAECVTVTLR